MKNNEIPLLPEYVYHIYTHANGKENLFETNENYRYFLKRYLYFIEPIAHTFAYCLMPNHIHVLVEIKSLHSLQIANQLFVSAKSPSKIVEPLSESLIPHFLSRTFGNLFSAYSQAFNRQQNRKGSLFIPNFKRKLVESELYYTKLIHYIHANPVHHGFVKNSEDWPHSSYNSLLSNKATKLKRAEVMNWFGGRNAFVEFHRSEPLDAQLGF